MHRNISESTVQTYSSEQPRSVTDAVLDTITEHNGVDLLAPDFILYEDIDPEALDRLFEANAVSGLFVAFSTHSVRVELRNHGDIEIRVSDRVPA